MWFKNPNAKIRHLQEELDATKNLLQEALARQNSKQTVLASGSLVFMQLYYFKHDVITTRTYRYDPTYLRETYHLTAEDAFADSQRKDACVSTVNVLKIGEQYFRPIANELVLLQIGGSKDRMIRYNG